MGVERGRGVPGAGAIKKTSCWVLKEQPTPSLGWSAGWPVPGGGFRELVASGVVFSGARSCLATKLSFPLFPCFVPGLSGVSWVVWGFLGCLGCGWGLGCVVVLVVGVWLLFEMCIVDASIFVVKL